MLEKRIPKPGSSEAVRQGCLCAVLRDGGGWEAFGFGKDIFYIKAVCPLHGYKYKEDDNEKSS